MTLEFPHLHITNDSSCNLEHLKILQARDENTVIEILCVPLARLCLESPRIRRVQDT